MPPPRDPFAALADPTRRTILELLRDSGPMRAGDIAAQFPSISRIAVTKHLAVLAETGLVSVETRGRERHYALEPAMLRELYGHWLQSFAPAWAIVASGAIIRSSSHSPRLKAV